MVDFKFDALYMVSLASAVIERQGRGPVSRVYGAHSTNSQLFVIIHVYKYILEKWFPLVRE